MIPELKAEGIRRLTTLVEKFDLNPNLIKYLKEDKLYYSYVYSVDTITYNPAYASLVDDFEKKYNCYVYHAIEATNNFDLPTTSMFQIRKDTKALILLYVSNNKNEWTFEFTNSDLVKGYVAYLDGDGSGFKNVKLFAPANVLIANILSENSSSPDDPMLDEALARIAIMEKHGLLTDFDISQCLSDGEPCFSHATNVFGDIVGVLVPISQSAQYSLLLQHFETTGLGYHYICIAANTVKFGHTFTVLFVPKNNSIWDKEKNLLESNIATAYIYNLDDRSEKMCFIHYLMFSGGPIMVEQIGNEF